MAEAQVGIKSIFRICENGEGESLSLVPVAEEDFPEIMTVADQCFRPVAKNACLFNITKEDDISAIDRANRALYRRQMTYVVGYTNGEFVCVLAPFS